MYIYLMLNIHKEYKLHILEISLELEAFKIIYLNRVLFQHQKIVFHLYLFPHKLNPY
jgi:hypothetical protein